MICSVANLRLMPVNINNVHIFIELSIWLILFDGEKTCHRKIFPKKTLSEYLTYRKILKKF